MGSRRLGTSGNADDGTCKVENRRLAPSGLVHTWRLWRHCCCRYGWYPVLISPIVTAGTLVSIYSSAGCDFIRVNVGFTPSNMAWNQSRVELGVLHYQSGIDDQSRYQDALFDGCRPYPSDFTDMFIDDDRTWMVTRIMSYISGISGIVATVMMWLFVVTPLPAYFFWPGVLLPALMVAFLAEGSKFLFFDTAICRNTIWFPSGADSLPRVAESCELGTSGFHAIVAGVIYFLCLIIVCLVAPEKRELDLNYGQDLRRNGTETDSANIMERGQSTDDETVHRPATVDKTVRHDDDGFVRVGSQTGQTIRIPSTQTLHDHHRCVPVVDASRNDGIIRIKPSAASRLKALDTAEAAARKQTEETTRNVGDDKDDTAEDESGEVKTKPTSGSTASDKKQTADDTSEQSKVSESRVNAVEKLQVNTETGDDKIEKFVADLNRSFNLDSNKNEAEEKGTKSSMTPIGTYFQTLCTGIPPSASSF